MKTIQLSKLLFCLSLLAIFWSCTSDSENDFPDREYPLVLSAQVEGMDAPVLRSVPNIGNTGVFVAGGASYTNAQYTSTNGTLTSATRGYWSSTSDIDIYAYAPYQATAPTSLAVQTDQSAEADYTANDFLYASPATFTFANRSNISLTYKHHLSKINLTLVAGEGISGADLATAVVQLTGTYTKATIAIATGSLTALSDAVPITPHADGTNRYKAITLPQAVAAGTSLFEVSVGTRSFDYTLPTPQVFEQGKQYNYTLTIAQGGITVSPVAISQWSEEVKDPNGISDKIYRLGDYYPNPDVDLSDPTEKAKIQGIVFTVDLAGRHGKIVSLNEGAGLAWGPRDVTTGASGDWDGSVPTKTIQAIANWETDYPVFNWVHVNKNNREKLVDGGQWYIPGVWELKQVYAAYNGTYDVGNLGNPDPAARTTFNNKLTAAGGTALSNNRYWSGSELHSNGAWNVNFSDGGVGSGSKLNSYRARAVRAF